MRLHKVSWVLYIVGSLLVFGSWVNLVPTGLGWIGWLMALVGWAVTGATNSSRERVAVSVVRPISRVEEIEKLDLLRREGVISEEEFLREKARLLSGG